METIKKLFWMIVLMTSIPSYGQTFPQYFPLSSYDINKGTNGTITWINYNGIKPNVTNKAIIFGTSINASDTYPTDLFRLTDSGVATFNSPFPGYSQTIEIRNQGILDGRLRTSGTMLDIEGSSAVNIGTISNPFVLQVNSNNVISHAGYEVQGILTTLKMGVNIFDNEAWIGTRTNSSLGIGVSSGTALVVEKGSQNIYIGLSNSEISGISQVNKANNKLFVKNGILSEDYSVAPVSSWADYVFEPNYKLKSLREVESYINENGHLPDVPSASEVTKDGYSQTEMIKILLMKIEELNLYVIQQQKEIESLKSTLAK